MRLAAVSVLTLLLSSAAFAQLEPGFIVQSGAPFPIVADFNGDGLDDLVQERNVILNDGASLTDVRDLGLDGEKVVGVLDANGDGRLDLLTMGASVPRPAYLPQLPMQGAGYRLYIADDSRAYPVAIDISTGVRPYIADVNDDGKDDFLIMDDVRPDGFRSTATDVTVLRSRGDGTFDRLETFRIPASPQITPDHRVLSGDLNHDGMTDLVIRCVQDLVVLRGTGGGAFAVESRHLPHNRSFGVWPARLGDIDGDSHLDIVLPALRAIRVFFGDGRGNFPRTARTSIAKTHEIEVPLGVTVPANINEPRNLALGHFTRNDRMQIAAGTVEGDIVVYSWEENALQEVSRTRTEFWHLDIRSGSFHGSADTDLYAIGTLIWGDVWPRPRLFLGANDGIATGQSSRASGRRRATRSGALASALQMEMQCECVSEPAAQWKFSREGLFGVAKRGQTTIEAVFDAPEIHFRLNAPYAQEPVYGLLAEENGAYVGKAQVLTSCGWRTMNVHAKLE